MEIRRNGGRFENLTNNKQKVNLRIFAKFIFTIFVKIFSLESVHFFKIKDSKFNYLKNFLLNFMDISENNHWRKCELVKYYLVFLCN